MPKAGLLLQGKDTTQLSGNGAAFTHNTEWGSERIYFEGDYIYKAWADAGASESDSVWRILRIYINPVGGNVDKKWADGDTLFDNSFTNRASLTYI